MFDNARETIDGVVQDLAALAALVLLGSTMFIWGDALLDIARM